MAGKGVVVAVVVKTMAAKGASASGGAEDIGRNSANKAVVSAGGAGQRA